MDLPVSSRLAGPQIAKEYDDALSALFEEDSNSNNNPTTAAGQANNTTTNNTNNQEDRWLPLHRETQQILDAGIRRAFGFPSTGGQVAVKYLFTPSGDQQPN